MEKWNTLKNLYIKDHLSKKLKSPNLRLNALKNVETLLTNYYPEIVKDPANLNKISKNDLKVKLAQKKGIPLNSAESSVINGLYNFLPFLSHRETPDLPIVAIKAGSSSTLQMNNLEVDKRDISARITYTTTEIIKKSFEPICDSDTSILILGTLPGDKSLKIGEYYGHPRNRFWQIIASITENSIPKTYTEKKNLLYRINIGVGDIAHSAARIGSLDTSIENEEPNDLLSFFKKYKNIRTVAFNGVKSEKLYNKYFLKMAEINYVLLPSSSPANAGISLGEICKQWAKRLALLR